MDHYYDSYGLGVGGSIAVMIISIAIDVGLAFIVGNIAKKKGYSFAGFWCLSFFCGFFIPFIVVLCLSDRNVRNYGQPYQQPYGQPYQQPYGQPYQQPYQQSQTIICPNCGNSVSADSSFCSKCGTKVK